MPSCSSSAGGRAEARSAPPRAASANLSAVLHRYERVLVPEMNTGQLAQLLRAEYLVDVESYTKLEGKPLFAAELEREFLERL